MDLLLAVNHCPIATYHTKADCPQWNRLRISPQYSRSSLRGTRGRHWSLVTCQWSTVKYAPWWNMLPIGIIDSTGQVVFHRAGRISPQYSRSSLWGRRGKHLLRWHPPKRWLCHNCNPEPHLPPPKGMSSAQPCRSTRRVFWWAGYIPVNPSLKKFHISMFIGGK